MTHRKQSSFKQAPRQLPKRPLPRNYSALSQRAPTPSDEYDWDAALYRYAMIMRSRGYTLSEQQQKRIEQHG